MKIKVILSTVLLVLLGRGIVWAGEPWQDKPYTEWTAEDVNRVLQDSPWAEVAMWAVREVPESREMTRPVPLPSSTFGSGIPLGADSVRFPQGAEMKIPARGPYYEYETVNTVIRWESSRTVREALARALQLRGLFTPELAAQLLRETPAHHEIFVGGPWLELILDEIARPGGEKEAEWPYDGVSQDVLETCLLVVEPEEGAAFKVHPVEVEFVIKSKQSPALVFRFPRMNIEVPPNDVSHHPGKGEPSVWFVWNTPKGKLATGFLLRFMQRDGKPDL